MEVLLYYFQPQKNKASNQPFHQKQHCQTLSIPVQPPTHQTHKNQVAYEETNLLFAGPGKNKFQYPSSFIQSQEPKRTDLTL